MTDSQLTRKLEAVRSEQRKLDKAIIEQSIRDNVILSGVVRGVRHRKR